MHATAEARTGEQCRFECVRDGNRFVKFIKMRLVTASTVPRACPTTCQINNRVLVVVDNTQISKAENVDAQVM